MTLPHPDMQCRVFIIKTEGFLCAAAIDAHHRTCPRWHDMAAGTIPPPDVISPKQLMTIRGTLMAIRVKQTTNDNSLP